jgi:hypothetical protein
MSRARCSAGKRSFSDGTYCSAGHFGLAELVVCALSKTYLEQLAIGELISRTSFRAPTLNPITPPGVLPTQAGCNRAAARLQYRGPILSAVTRDRRNMGTQRRIRHKIFEWLWRYAPNEIAGWVGQLGAAAATYALTGSYAAAVIAATIGASAGYYAVAYFNGVRWSYRAHAARSWPMRVLVANGLAARSIAVEFGPAEAIDSITIRPIALYLGPLVVGNTAVGFVLGSIVADIAFYVMAIFSYERFTKLLARPQPASVPA